MSNVAVTLTEMRDHKMSETDSNYDTSIHPVSGGLYQAYLHEKIKVKNGIKLGSPLYHSEKYSTEDEAYKDVINYFKSKYSK